VTPTAPGPAPLSVRLTTTLRRHWLIVALVVLAAAVRVLVMVAYPPAFWFLGDSGEYIGLATETFYPHRSRPLGYPIFLAAMSLTGTFVAVVGVQHLAGLALGVGVYALLRRRGLGPAPAGLAAVPVLFDALQIDLEQFILTETLFTALLSAAIGVLLWFTRPGPVATGVAGLLVAGAWLTRPIALGVAVLLAGYLLLRRTGARSVIAFIVAFTVPVGSVLAWIDGRPSAHNSGSTGLFLYGRTAMIADCDRLELDAELRSLCPDTPVSERSGRADYYIWVHLTPEMRDDPVKDPVLRAFAVAVITQQPGDYLALVARETAVYFVPGLDLGPEHRGLAQWWTLPAAVREGAVPWLAGPGFARDPADPASAPPPTALTEALHWYGVHVRTPPLVNTLVVLATIIALVLALRRRSATGPDAVQWRDARDGALLTLVAVALLVASVATSMYEQRYGLPTLPLFCVAAGLAWSALTRPRQRDAGTPAHG
jgi:hypothetical protein